MENRIHTYCLMCRTGTEKNVVREIARAAPLLEAIAPVRILREKRSSTWRSIEKPLLPGYVFVYSVTSEIPASVLRRIRNIYKILDYDQGLRRLREEDHAYAMWLYRYHGEIEPSKVLAEGQRVIAIEGPLSDVCGTIVRLDKRKRKAWVEFDFDGHKRRVSLSAEWIVADAAERS